MVDELDDGLARLNDLVLDAFMLERTLQVPAAGERPATKNLLCALLHKRVQIEVVQVSQTVVQLIHHPGNGEGPPAPLRGTHSLVVTWGFDLDAEELRCVFLRARCCRLFVQS